MKRTPDELRKMMAEFETVLRREGVKVTPQRLEIYRRTAETTDHPAIEAVHRAVRRAMPHISLDTVYRALALFAGLGLVTTVRPQGQPRTRIDANISPHHHFICDRCRATLDFEDRAFDDLPVPPSASALGRVVSRHIELRGLCAACAAGAVRRGRPARASAPRPIGTRSHRRYHNNIRRD
jgi:Fur family transcriptional regulator, peroxide stress response regulator